METSITVAGSTKQDLGQSLVPRTERLLSLIDKFVLSTVGEDYDPTPSAIREAVNPEIDRIPDSLRSLVRAFCEARIDHWQRVREASKNAMGINMALRRIQEERVDDEAKRARIFKLTVDLPKLCLDTDWELGFKYAGYLTTLLSGEVICRHGRTDEFLDVYPYSYPLQMKFGRRIDLYENIGAAR